MIDLAALRGREWAPRTRSIPAPTLATDGAEDASWTVRAPTANELAIANESRERRAQLDGLVEALAKGGKSKIVSEFREKFGLGGDLRPDIARRMDLLVLCSVDPVCEEQDAVWLAEHHPVLFYALTNTIIELAGDGSEVKKTPPDSMQISP